MSTIKGTEVAYHRDGYRPSRPAINVKVHGFRAVQEAARLLEANPAIGEAQTEWLFEAAEREVYGRFWKDAQGMAYSLGLGDIEQEGRSGGWLVFADGRDPQDFGGKARVEWLRAYRTMADWCDTQVRSADAAVAAEAMYLATEEAVTP